MALLARQFLSQWIGGMATVRWEGLGPNKECFIQIYPINHFCLQTDLVEWLTEKTVKNMLERRGKGGGGKTEDDGKEWKRFQLAQYLRLHLAGSSS
jgi:hypothetical protein